jgi:hypothetical protein
MGYSFCVADCVDDRALGTAGLWLADLAKGRATVGYTVAPSARGCGVAVAALRALTLFAWTLPELFRIELYVEPWNTASIEWQKPPATCARVYFAATSPSVTAVQTCCSTRYCDRSAPSPRTACVLSHRFRTTARGVTLPCASGGSAIGQRAGSGVTAVPCGQVGSSLDRAPRGRPLPGVTERRGKP